MYGGMRNEINFNMFNDIIFTGSDANDYTLLNLI